MHRDFRLLESNLLENSHFPVIAFFNAIPNSNFLDVMEQLSLGIGRGINDTVCTFPEELDPDEETFEGIMFSLYDEEVIIKHQTFLYYLQMACAVYLEDCPDKKGIIEIYFNKIKDR
jgi:hypothetical protein